MNAVAFSLYGRAERYNVGAIKNAEMAREFYPGWQVHLWHRDVTEGILATLGGLGVSLHPIPPWCVNGMFGRFLVHDLPGVERFVVRDADSRFSRREVIAVEEWVKAGTQLHVMRDHPYHNQCMMGGMWGWRRVDPDSKLQDGHFQDWASIDRYGADQEYLARHVWFRAESKTIHDSCGTFGDFQNWPPADENFVGEYIDQHGKPNWKHRAVRWNFLRGLGVVK